ncbi:hypothetical protein [Defluviimonas salinarum]|uniref:Uncharacterized protein n=1 Tax=Defluviimonas salinarum TaxID=2992147 RepID=A0ABT3J5N4_9RHOB|nr:hypothetical protein [Defluviimonas salinarum]MCW3782988.1 hypothetical protein [Defluviimonas salinarum]
MYLRLGEVLHVGSLDPASRTARASLEGPCLSVSVDPEDWGHIARVSGPTWTLVRPGALWLDACGLGDAEKARIRDWAKTAGLAEETTAWRAWQYDDEADDWRYMTLPTREAAEAECQDMDPDGVPSDNGELVEPVAALRLTQAAMARLERWHDPLDGEAGALILYAMEVLEPDHPDLVGIWWNEIHDPLSLSCPRGGVLPARLDEFDIRDEYGNLPPFRREEDPQP